MGLKIWGRKSSSNVQAVMWCVGELELEHVRFDIGHSFGGTETDEFAAMNPNRTVPVLQDGTNAQIWETGAILRYLAACYGSESFWPKNAATRAGVDKWAEWAKLNIAVGFTVPVFWQVVRTAAADQDPLAIRAAVSALSRKLGIADERLKDVPFLAGQEFTLADIQFGHLLYRYFDIPIPRPDLPSLQAYYERLCARPMYRHHVMVSYEELRVT